MFGLSSNGWKCTSAATRSPTRSSASSIPLSPMTHQGQDTSETKSIFMGFVMAAPDQFRECAEYSVDLDCCTSRRRLRGIGDRRNEPKTDDCRILALLSDYGRQELVCPPPNCPFSFFSQGRPDRLDREKQGATVSRIFK